MTMPKWRQKRESFDGTQVYETEEMVFFWQPPAVYGQWTPSSFTVEGTDYVNAEQWMMAGKARLFGDTEALGKMMATSDPREHKRLGRTVKGYDNETWVANAEPIVVEGNYAKFTQNPEMLRELLATGEKLLVEASPYDKIWGIGLRADHEDARDVSKWRGENKLGKALMTVRARIRQEMEAK
ncbi:unnamed protein product [Chrysoparadoxa australica]